MASGVFDDALIKHLWSSDEFGQIFSDANRVQKWYDFEAALALEQAELGIIPRAAANEIAAKAKVANVDVEAIAAEIRRIKHPLVPALKAVQELCKPEHGEFIHFGPTTQDVLDTGTVLQMKDAHAAYLRDMKAIGRELYRLSEKYRDDANGGAHARRAGAAHHVRPQVRGLALGNGAALRAHAPARAARFRRRHGRRGRHPGVVRTQSARTRTRPDEAAGPRASPTSTGSRRATASLNTCACSA